VMLPSDHFVGDDTIFMEHVVQVLTILLEHLRFRGSRGHPHLIKGGRRFATPSLPKSAPRRRVATG